MKFDIVIVGAGHAGCEAALCSARRGLKVALLTLNPDSIAYMACNPSIGGTAKGHLVREIDALGGEMGVNADATMLQIKMLNASKGAAVQSLRAQSDKLSYHLKMKETIEKEKNIRIICSEVCEIICDKKIENGCDNNATSICEKPKVIGVKTTLGQEIMADAVVVCAGVYLNSTTIVGECVQSSGPSGFAPSNALTDSLIKLGVIIKRFKTGTPARVHKRSIDLSKLSEVNGDENIYPFSHLSEFYLKNQTPCYLGYTNSKTHDIIRENLHRSPLYGGVIKGVGPRYCPSIEDKVVRFSDKERHQIFVEPESSSSCEVYIQGMSTSMPRDVQELMYSSLEGFENVEIVRSAYAIEYDAIESTQLYPTLAYKNVLGLYFAGQINGSSGYEEAAAQGLIAGINATCYVLKESPVVLERNTSYIGVLIDDLVTKGTNEPYRMMTARAEHRLYLRQDNADTRLTPIAIKLNLASDARIEKFNRDKEELALAKEYLSRGVSPKEINEYLSEIGETSVENGSTLENIIKRPLVRLLKLREVLGIMQEFSPLTIIRLETYAKYKGYLEKEELSINKAKKMEDKALPIDIDYSKILGLRLEARQKLAKIMPMSLGQASRISGVSPADINVLMLFLMSSEKVVK